MSVERLAPGIGLIGLRCTVDDIVYGYIRRVVSWIVQSDVTMLLALFIVPVTVALILLFIYSDLCKYSGALHNYFSLLIVW